MGGGDGQDPVEAERQPESMPVSACPMRVTLVLFVLSGLCILSRVVESFRARWLRRDELQFVFQEDNLFLNCAIHNAECWSMENGNVFDFHRLRGSWGSRSGINQDDLA